MHLQVRGASRLGQLGLAIVRECVLMHLQVRGASRHDRRGVESVRDIGLNAPTGARRLPTALLGESMVQCHVSLNAPTGARRFPTVIFTSATSGSSRLNAPTGARRFPTGGVCLMGFFEES